MELTEIIKDSFKYPFSDKRQFGLILMVFVLLGIIIFGSFFSIRISTGITPILMAISFIIALIVFILVGGYQLDIIEIACEEDDGMPSFNPIKNIKNGLKVILVYLVFYIINALISFIGLISAIALLLTHWSCSGHCYLCGYSDCRNHNQLDIFNVSVQTCIL